MDSTKKNTSDSEDARRLKAIWENAIDGLITIDQRGRIEDINPAAARLFGYQPEEIAGKNVKILMPEPFHSAHDRYIDNYHQTGIKKIIGIGREVMGKRKDGTVFPFYLSVSEVFLDDVKIYTGIIHDISSLKIKEQELIESENHLKAIFNTAVEGIVIISSNGDIQMINPAITQLFGYAEEELIGKNIKMLLPPSQQHLHDGYMDRYKKTLETRIIGVSREEQGQHKDGSIIPFNLAVSEVQLGDRVIFTGIIHDLSKQKKVENEIRDLSLSLEKKVASRTQELSETVNKLLSVNKQLEFEVSERKKAEAALRQSELETRAALEKEKELNELKSRFVSMASHEFRTPLSTIQSSAALIGRYTESDQQEKRQKHIDRIKSSVNNLTGILNDFLSISKLEEGKIKAEPERFSLTELCSEVTDEIQGLLKPGQGILHHDQTIGLLVNMDRRLIKNILFNLLSNAIKYSPENKTIDCFTHAADRHLHLEIKDQGMGIPLADQEHLFSRFFRATNVSNIQGTGLGLNIVKRYIELLKGNITFESTEGAGTTFKVILPLEE